MKLYILYIIRNLLSTSSLIAITITGIIWLTQSLRFVDLIVSKGLSLTDFVFLSSLLLPSLFMIILPVSLFVAVIYTYNKLTIDSELIVLKGAGSSNLQLAIPAIIVSIIFAIICYAISLHFLPKSYREFKDTQSYIRNNYSSLLIQEGVFNTPTKGLTVYVDKKQDDGKLKGILVYDSRNKSNPITMMAQEGRIVLNNESSRFELSDGNRQEINKNNNQLSLLYFKEYVMDFSSYTNDEVKRVRDARERFIGELFSPKETNISDKFRNKLMAEAHQRLTWPFFNIVLTLIALSVLLSGQLNRRGQWKRIMIASFIAFIAITSNFGLNNIISSHPKLVPMMYINIIIIILFCLLAINQYNYKKIKNIFGKS